MKKNSLLQLFIFHSLLTTFFAGCAVWNKSVKGINKQKKNVIKGPSSVQWLVEEGKPVSVKKEVKYKKLPRFRIQIAASRSKDGAEGIAKSVEDLIPGVRPHIVEDGGMFKVRMGDFISKKDTEPVKQKLVETGFIDCLVCQDMVEVPISADEGEDEFIDPAKYRVQIASCKLKESAENIKSNLSLGGVKQKIYIIEENGMYKVRAGNARDRNEAEKIRQEIIKLGYSDAWIVGPTQKPGSEISTKSVPVGLNFSKEVVDNIKIGIIRNQPQIVVYSNGDFEFRDRNDGLILDGKSWDMWTIKLGGEWMSDNRHSERKRRISSDETIPPYQVRGQGNKRVIGQPPEGEVGKTVYRAAVVSYKDEATANSAAETIRQQLPGVPVYVIYEEPWYKVRVGDYATREEANQVVEKLKLLGYDDSWVHKMTIQPTKKSNLVLIAPDENIKGEFEDAIYLVPKTTFSYIGVGGKLYKGKLIVRVGIDGLLTVVNQVNLDDYVKGVIPKEIGADKHEEALKAQAIAARTEALAKLGRHSDDGFDLCAMVCCQVYGGVSAETPRTNKAVEDTAGEVLTIQGRLAGTVYHACCGGHTEDVRYVWGGGAEYLAAVPCFDHGMNTEYHFPLSKKENFVTWVKSKPRGYCEDYTKYYRWEKKLRQSKLESLFAKNGYNIGKLVDIKLGDRGPAGTLQSMTIIGTEGQYTITKQGKIRDAFAETPGRGPFDHYSGKFIIEVEVDATTGEKIWKFIGCGWGHGVGMCQYGAATMAAKYNKTAQQILLHYFPGTEIKKVY